MNSGFSWGQWLKWNLGLWAFWIFIALLIRIFLFQPFHIPSRSMVPTLLVGDHLFVSKYAYGYSRYAFPFQSGAVSGRVFAKTPKRGDVVVFRPPQNDSQDYIKRVIGLPGDEVQMRQGELYINRKKVRRTQKSLYEWREYLPSGKAHLLLDQIPYSQSDDTRAFIVPEHHIFVMGDNRDNSSDSRFIGSIPMNNLIGRAEMIYFSIDDIDNYSQFWKWIRFERLGLIIE